MRLLVGSSVDWAGAYGEVEHVEEYNLDKPMAAAAVLDELSDLIDVARTHGGPAKMILVLEPKHGSAVMGQIFEFEKYDLTKSLSRASLIDEIKEMVKKANTIIEASFSKQKKD